MRGNPPRTLHWQKSRPVGDRTVIVPHPKKDLPQGTAKAIAKQAGRE
ncbi:type II toxin-antitoxin system HicA family toxin [Ochrobactrum sp. BTU1]